MLDTNTLVSGVISSGIPIVTAAQAVQHIRTCT
jgi:hypothetical protein